MNRCDRCNAEVSDPIRVVTCDMEAPYCPGPCWSLCDACHAALERWMSPGYVELLAEGRRVFERGYPGPGPAPEFVDRARAEAWWIDHAELLLGL
uniref:Uncharacterized protein n=1 Tax=viral metagenome TaxID=1070528 RepID=A0A6M3M0D2_9ZZZZ